MSMKLVVTETLIDGQIGTAQSEDGRYKWFWLQGSYIVDTQADRTVCQMSYMRRKDQDFASYTLPDDVANDIRAFWDALFDEQKRRRKEKEATDIAALKAMQASSNNYAYRPEITDMVERKQLEREYDNIQNEGYADGFNPFRDM